MMDSAYDTVGIWKHGKLIIGLLSFLFLLSVGADVALWYSLHKSNGAADTLNEIIANQPPAPKTDADKIKLLDSLAAAHSAAVAQIAGAASEHPAAINASSTSPATQQSINAKIKILDSPRQPH